MPADDLRLQPKMYTALEIAVLAQTIPIQAAADLIESYARCVAAGAKIDAYNEAVSRFDRALDFRGGVDA